MARALTQAGNTRGRVTTAATIMEAAPAFTMAVDLTRTTATTRAGRTRTGVTADPGDITRTRTMAVIRTVVTTTTTRTTRRRTAITHQWLQLCAAVQRRLGQLGYYHGVVDGVIGPQTRGAIASFETVDGSISRPLLDQFGLA